jgi:hypothetical protein
MKKITKLQKISLIVLGVLVLVGLGFYFNQRVLAQTTGAVLPTPTIQDQVFPGGVIFSWKVSKKDVYGFRIARRTAGVKNYKTIAIFNPDPVGYAHISDGGFYTDLTVLKGRTYVYFITTFDRQGNESSAATSTITAQ